MPTKRTYEFVKSAFSENGYELISREYINNKQRLEYICPKHPNETQTTRLNDLLSGHGCKSCGRERIAQNLKNMAKEQRLSYEDVQQEFIKRGYELLSREYTRASESLEYRCPAHPNEKLTVRISDLKRGSGCRYCAIDKMKVPFEDVKYLFEINGYNLLDTEYRNSNTPLRFECPRHPEEETTITYASLIEGHQCLLCSIEDSRGENSVHYKHEISPEERAKDRRLDPDNHAWRASVFQRDKFTCQYCGKGSQNDLNAHHKDAHHWCIERRYDITNGVTL